MIENTNTKQFYPGPILNNTLEITDFLFNEAEQIKITHSKFNEAGILTNVELNYPTDYEVLKVLPSDINASEAALTASTGQVTLKNITVQAGEKLTIYRSSQIIQDRDYPRTGAFPAASHEGALDYLTMQNQEQKDEIDRALKVPVSTEGFSGNLPVPIPSRALKINNDGTGFEMSEFDPDLTLITTEEFKNQAQQAATNALSSKTAAANSERNAKSSETIASQKANQVSNIYNQAVPELTSIIDNGITTLSNASNALRTTQITNCIKEIPQRIKYTFVDGTFTLLKGSVLIFPHGTTNLSSSYPVGSNYYNSNFKVVNRQYANGLFFVWAEMQADKTTSQTGTATADSNILYVNAERNTFGFNGAGAVFSGTTKPTAGQIWYDTTNNVLNYSNDNFATYTQLKLSFPICNFARESGVITNIDQVFNGMGYIGSTQWYDKDIVGLSPNGLNSDGTYNNAEIRRTRLTVRTFGTETTTNSYNWQLSSNAHRDLKDYYVQDTQPALSGNWLWHDTLNNKLYGYTDSAGLIDMSGTFFVGGFGTRTNGVVTSFNPKQTFRAVDYNDKSQIVSWGMPSSKYIDLTLGASDSRYTAPANGWLFLQMAYQEDKYIDLFNSTSQTGSIMTSASANTVLRTMIPCRKGDNIAIRYTATTVQTFRFVYAEGEV